MWALPAQHVVPQGRAQAGSELLAPCAGWQQRGWGADGSLGNGAAPLTGTEQDLVFRWLSYHGVFHILGLRAIGKSVHVNALAEGGCSPQPVCCALKVRTFFQQIHSTRGCLPHILLSPGSVRSAWHQTQPGAVPCPLLGVATASRLCPSSPWDGKVQPAHTSLHGTEGKGLTKGDGFSSQLCRKKTCSALTIAPEA